MGDDGDPHTAPDHGGEDPPAQTDAGDGRTAGSAAGDRETSGGSGGDRNPEAARDRTESADRRDRLSASAVDEPTDDLLRALFRDLWETLEESGDPAALSSYMSAITASDWKQYSDREVFEHLLDSVFAPGRTWPDYEVYRSAIHAALGDYRRVAGFDEGDVERVSENPALEGDRGRVRVAVVNARRFAAVVRDCGSFEAYLRLFDGDGERALAAVENRFALGGRGTREFLGNVGYRPVVSRETSVGRTLARVGVVSDPQAYDEVEAAVTRIGDLTHRRWAVVDRVFWCHGFGPDVVGLGGPICGAEPNCWACLVGDCASRQDPVTERR